MSATTTIKVVGVKDAINNLRKIDPALQKQFKEDAKEIAEPAIKAAKTAYKVLSDDQHPYALSGMARNWSSNGRKIFPFKLDRAIKGVQVKFDTRKKAIGVILIIQKDTAAAVFESAGRKTTNNLGRSLGFLSQNTTRIIGPAVDGEIVAVTKQMSQMVKRTMSTVQKDL